MANRQKMAADFKLGQVWQLPDSRIEIGHVGRTLVHYRRAKGGAVCPPTQLSSQATLQDALHEAKAVLTGLTTSWPPAGMLRMLKSGPRTRS